MKKLTSLLLFSILLAACTSLHNTNIRKNEVTDIAVNQKDEVFTEQQMKASAAKSRGAVSDAAFSLAFKGVKYLIDKDKKQYVAEYGNSLYYSTFYKEISTLNALDPKGMQFDGFRFIRTIDSRKKEGDTALILDFELDKSNPAEMFSSSRFKLRLKDFRMDYSKAKVPAAGGCMPWAWFYKNEKKMNLDVEISIYATWVNEQTQLFDKVPVGKFYLNLRDIPLDRESPEFQSYRDKLKGISLDGSSFFIPRSYGHFFDPLLGKFIQCYGKGYYHIDVKVVEAGNKKFAQQVIEDNSPMILKELENQVKKTIK